MSEPLPERPAEPLHVPPDWGPATRSRLVPGRCYCGTPANPEASILGHEYRKGRCLYRIYPSDPHRKGASS